MQRIQTNKKKRLNKEKGCDHSAQCSFYLSSFLFPFFLCWSPFFLYIYTCTHTHIQRHLWRWIRDIQEGQEEQEKKEGFPTGSSVPRSGGNPNRDLLFFSFVNSTPPSYPHDTRYNTPDYLLPQLLIRLRFERPILSSGFWNQVHFINLSSYLSDCILWLDYLTDWPGGSRIHRKGLNWLTIYLSELGCSVLIDL